MAFVVDAVHAHDYVVAVRDDADRFFLVDLTEALTGHLAPCREMSVFSGVRAVTGTLVWPGGYDIDPEHVMALAKPLTSDKARVTLQAADRSKILTHREDLMPIISVFFGLIVRMFHDERRHDTPHLHAFYGEDEAVYDIISGETLTGELPRRQDRLVQAWIELHRDELRANWELLRAGEQPVLVKGLE